MAKYQEIGVDVSFTTTVTVSCLVTVEGGEKEALQKLKESLQTVEGRVRILRDAVDYTEPGELISDEDIKGLFFAQSGSEIKVDWDTLEVLGEYDPGEKEHVPYLD